jgi:hypothetical protein
VAFSASIRSSVWPPFWLLVQRIEKEIKQVMAEKEGEALASLN